MNVGYRCKAGLESPGMEEVEPVHVGSYFVDGVGQYFGYVVGHKLLELIESQFFAAIGFVHFSVTVNQVPVGKCLLHLPVERAPFERAPSAFAQDAVGRDLPRSGVADQYKVCLISLADIASFAYAIYPCRRMAHFLYNGFYGEDALFRQFEHADQRVLNHGHARHGFQCTALFLAQQVRGVVGGNHVDKSVLYGFPQGQAVALFLDGGVALDACAQLLVVVLCEHQVGDACFGCD